MAASYLAVLALAPFALYATFLALLCFEQIQQHLIFLHRVRLSGQSNFDAPESYGFAPYRVHNLRIPIGKDQHLGAWLLPALSSYSTRIESLPMRPSQAVYADILRTSNRPTLMYMHGNAATRAVGFRMRAARILANELDFNVVMLDYRGFGDSSSIRPSQATAVQDAGRLFEWLNREIGVHAHDIVCYGHSLGTGICADLVARQLAPQDIHLRALILIAPFKSIPSLLTTYRLFGLIPIMGPLRKSRHVEALVRTFLTTRFETDTILSLAQCPLLLIHSTNDHDIVYTHSRELFDNVFLNSTIGATSIAQQTMYGHGLLRHFTRSNGSPVVHLEIDSGGHNGVGTLEVSTLAIKRIVEPLG
ncbi:uncharacterized protein L969DRAFT_620731 [Mixia osmundae IAM 14324]|uniref:AB hydrolase-1 domain-containing protein n=1 Tax=Mixia osmundae (strain CBS 9802 / IAM 14324 / JCM 22182 / KY 12970) TaxID=764103 RepID=G7E941_MIXOS|nr:uncharacterized protein L969DRAFT_620731 [Mixia osmundae IAM 14324]KEI40295.1 hypothetical protein L969DRAFT_620731 [Mixia osmundae IAM 14324]GAA99659.1 hypothetical protein E5Q_06362 [Mixia osmundae IAM 14324]